MCTSTDATREPTTTADTRAPIDTPAPACTNTPPPEAEAAVT